MPIHNSTPDRRVLQDFIDALREMLGLSPLYGQFDTSDGAAEHRVMNLLEDGQAHVDELALVAFGSTSKNAKSKTYSILRRVALPAMPGSGRWRLREPKAPQDHV